MCSGPPTRVARLQIGMQPGEVGDPALRGAPSLTDILPEVAWKSPTVHAHASPARQLIVGYLGGMGDAGAWAEMRMGVLHACTETCMGGLARMCRNAQGGLVHMRRDVAPGESRTCMRRGHGGPLRALPSGSKSKEAAEKAMKEKKCADPQWKGGPENPTNPVRPLYISEPKLEETDLGKLPCEVQPEQPGWGASQKSKEEPFRGMEERWEAQWQQFLKTLQPAHKGGDNPGFSEASPWEDTKAFLASFEQVAQACQWPSGQWVAHLLPALSGEAEDAFRSLEARDREDYGKVKAAILRGEALKMERQRQHFRQFCCQEVGDPRRIHSQLQELCLQWLRPEKHTKEQILELLILEQFLASLPSDLQSWIRAGGAATCSQAVALVEEFLRSQQEVKSESYELVQPAVELDSEKVRESGEDLDEGPAAAETKGATWEVQLAMGKAAVGQALTLIEKEIGVAYQYFREDHFSPYPESGGFLGLWRPCGSQKQARFWTSNRAIFPPSRASAQILHLPASKNGLRGDSCELAMVSCERWLWQVDLGKLAMASCPIPPH
ncbi:SCAN domain-containing protein 3, partial [Ophiophagus hannah]